MDNTSLPPVASNIVVACDFRLPPRPKVPRVRFVLSFAQAVSCAMRSQYSAQHTFHRLVRNVIFECFLFDEIDRGFVRLQPRLALFRINHAI
jgi:hypothetical protein